MCTSRILAPACGSGPHGWLNVGRRGWMKGAGMRLEASREGRDRPNLQGRFDWTLYGDTGTSLAALESSMFRAVEEKKRLTRRRSANISVGVTTVGDLVTAVSRIRSIKYCKSSLEDRRCSILAISSPMLGKESVVSLFRLLLSVRRRTALPEESS